MNIVCGFKAEVSKLQFEARQPATPYPGHCIKGPELGPQLAQLIALSSRAGRHFTRPMRREIMAANGWSLRDLYRTLETPGTNRLRDAHAALDTAVRAAYGMKDSEDTLAFLLCLNLELAEKEAEGEAITPPGLPAWAAKVESLVSPDCLRVS